MAVVGVTGHRSLPTGLRPYLEDALRGVLARAGVPLVGVSALAEGADQLFARAVLVSGGQIHAVIPCRHYESSIESEAGRTAYRSLRALATQVEVLDHDEPTDAAFLAAGRRIVDRVERLIAVWDGEPAHGVGGTGDVVSYARSKGVPVEILWPAGAER